MLSGALIRLPDDLDIQRLNGVNWVRGAGDLTLRSIIQSSERPLVVDRETTAQTALAIHQEIGAEPTLTEEHGRYRLVYNEVIKTTWSNIYAVRGYVVVDRLANRPFVKDIINKGLGLTIVAHHVSLDTARMVRDRPDQWIRGFSDRVGRVDRGTVFGEGVENDSVFGPELDRSTKNSVGWITNFFGSPTKVKVSPLGSVTVWANPPEGLFLRFIRNEVLPYAITLF